MSLKCQCQWPWVFLMGLFFICTCSISAENAKLHFNTTSERDLLRRIKAADVKSWMNTTEGPCKDFYNFACGNWARIQAGKVQEKIMVSRYDVYNNAMEKRVLKFLSELKSNNGIQNKIYDFMKSCKYIKTNQEQHKEDVKNVIRENFGEFSYLRRDHEGEKTPFNLWKTVATIYRLYDLGLIMHIDIDYDMKNSNKTAIYVGKPYKRTFRTSPSMIESRFKQFADISDAKAKQIAKDVHLFSETIIHSGIDFTRSGHSINQQYQLISVRDFKKIHSYFFDGEEYLKEALNITELPEYIYLERDSYLTELAGILMKTNPETIENYILYFIMQRLYVSPAINNFDYVCKIEVIYLFGKYVQHSVYNEFRSNEFEEQIYELWHDIKTVFHDDLKSLNYNWISNSSRDHAIKKLNNMKFIINSFDNEDFESYFHTLSIDPTNFALNLHNAHKQFKLHRGLQLERRTESLEDIMDSSFTPLYNPSLNEIRIPVSFLQPFHIWHPTYPKALLYAHIGSPVGHEMIHAFDDNGRHYDADGNANNWWDENASKEYEKRRQCFQMQYHSYIFAGKLLPELKAQGENIADNAGMRIAYKAYKNWLQKSRRHGKDLESEKFVNFAQYNEEQLFFIAFGQYRCQSVNERIMADLIRDDVHAPHRLRVNVPLSNFAEFSMVFQCNVGSEMNPVEKCEIF